LENSQPNKRKLLIETEGDLSAIVWVYT